MFKFVIACAIVAVCAAQVPQDSPEVAQAKAAHFAAVAEAQARSLGAPVYNPQFPVVATGSAFPTSSVFAPAPAFPSPVFHSAPVVPWKAWDGIPAPIVVANGHVQDTTEVAAEKNKHFSLVADAAVHSASTGPHDDGQYRHDPSGDYVPYVATPIAPAPYVHTPIVPVVRSGIPLPYQYATIPLVVANGFIQDTPEVAALKAARVAELRSAGGTV